ncbi:MAG: APC family permease [Pseudomonadota bacterium]
MAMRRDIGLVGLTFVAVGGMLGSGWLFAPLLSGQLAGPAALISWIIGASAILVLALTYAEISAMFPVAGAIARLPQLSHGRMFAMVVGWSAWAGYCTAAPIEVEASLRYASVYIPALHTGEQGEMNWVTYVVAAVLLFGFTIINALGVALFAKINSALTWAKIIAIAMVVGALVSTRFEVDNFLGPEGFAPFGMEGVFAAVGSGGVAMAFIGFRHAIDMAGETQNPQRNVPLALIFSILICFAAYASLQFAFTGAVTVAGTADGWSSLTASASGGPLMHLSTTLGILWLVAILKVASVISPFGGALVSVGSNGRLSMAIAENGLFPKLFAALNSKGVPVAALALNYVIGLILFFTLPFTELIALNSSAIVLSFVAGPLGVIAFRRLAPHMPRPFRLPAAQVICPAAFIVATLIVYWSGWETVWRLIVLIGLGFGLFFVRAASGIWNNLDARCALWLAPYLIAIVLLSVLGSFGGGLGVIAQPYDSVLAALIGVATFYGASRSHLPVERFDDLLQREHQTEMEEYQGTDDPTEKSVEAAIADERRSRQADPSRKDGDVLRRDGERL